MALFSNVTETLKALPVASVAAEVVQSVLAGKMTVLAAPTGSGKSMMVPAMLADATDEEVVVLVPRRFLATDAATNVAQMAGCKVGEAVGYSIGKMAGEGSKVSEQTKLRFVTYGYAISSGLINTARNLVLDEVHEASEDISLARAILHERRKNDPDMRLLEMSATIDATRQIGYWKDVSDTASHNVEGQTLKCEERRETPGRDSESEAESIIALLKEGRKGVAAFRSGVREVEDSVQLVKDLVKANPALGRVEVVGIHGGTPPDERDKARAAPPEGVRKVIIGTNVIESGVNLRWVDSGVSDGYGKIPYDRTDTGAEALVKEHLPQWRIVQQRGRINRAPDVSQFESGIFTLFSNKEMVQRPQQATPELARRSVLRVAFRAACLGYLPEDLKFDTTITPERWQEAKEDLIRLGLVDEYWQLTRDGKTASRLPVTPESAAILCEASRLDVAAQRSGDVDLRARPRLLGDAIIMAALRDQGGMRENGKRGHGMEGNSDIHGGSDIIDGLKAFRQLEQTHSAKMVADTANILASKDPKWIAELELARESLKAECGKLNVNYTDFCEVMLMVGEIHERYKKDPKAIDAVPADAYDPARYNALKQSLLSGSANQIFQLQEGGGYRDLLRDYGNRKNNLGEPFNGYAANEYSVVSGAQASSRTPLVVGNLREKPAKEGAASGAPEVILDQVTSIPAEVFVAWAASRETPLLDKVEYSRGSGNKAGELSARYSEKAEFSIPLGKASADLLAQLSQLKEAGSWSSQVGVSGSHTSRTR